MHAMCTVVCLSVGCHTEKSAEPIEMLFGGLIQLGPRNHVLDGVNTPTGSGNFWQFSSPLKSIWTLLQCMQQKESFSHR